MKEVNEPINGGNQKDESLNILKMNSSYSSSGDYPLLVVVVQYDQKAIAFLQKQKEVVVTVKECEGDLVESSCDGNEVVENAMDEQGIVMPQISPC